MATSWWRMTVRIPEFIVGLAIGSVVGYIALSVLTDIRIDKLRPFIERGAINSAVSQALATYKKEEAAYREKWTKENFEEIEILRKRMGIARKALR